MQLSLLIQPPISCTTNTKFLMWFATARLWHVSGISLTSKHQLTDWNLFLCVCVCAKMDKKQHLKGLLCLVKTNMEIIYSIIQSWNIQVHFGIPEERTSGSTGKGAESSIYEWTGNYNLETGIMIKILEHLKWETLKDGLKVKPAYQLIT